MTDMAVPAANVFAVMTRSAPELNVFQGHFLVPYNIPSREMRVSAVTSIVPVVQISQQMRASQMLALAIVKGQLDNPKLRAWTYTLDGHDYYILKLGTGSKTLVFDLSTGQWSWWCSANSTRWRASVGMNWRSAGTIPVNFGSNVVVGDDTLGALWVLDPEQGYDDHFFDGFDPVKFPRVATGQIPMDSRKALPIYSVDLTASVGYPALSDSVVSLDYSDDQGNTYVTADEPQVSTEGVYDQEFAWRSLGQVRSPGRLFRITDDGAFARIDSMVINE